ncbi:DNA-binding helix-turn-helix protein [Leptospira interrogans str. Kito]|nr:DNA-binding helix-turn-helix protein [Leptospira interrogans serovar Canicola str. Fiocruz LV133]EMK23193.1 DNA-binding helix-turn-helix protein [Leptospira interrogans str. Kito]EMN75648.1 DNA-binding helix-turn-helix protein [Leptospira interrogans str. UI 09600]POR18203.1 DNA-binding protein [Leptospira interrogans serovar Canicola]
MTTGQKIIKNKVGLLKLAEILGNVSKASNVMGYSRDSFYRFQELYEKGGELALQDLSRRKPNHKNRIEPEKEEAVKKMAIDFPAYGQQRASNELKKQGIIVAPCYGKKCMGSSRFGNFSKKTESIRSVHGPRRFSRINRIAGAGIRKKEIRKAS